MIIYQLFLIQLMIAFTKYVGTLDVPTMVALTDVTTIFSLCVYYALQRSLSIASLSITVCKSQREKSYSVERGHCNLNSAS